jgi:anti-sigma factor ChrR (cupin superfamily)
MISEQQQEQAALCALGLLSPEERERFVVEIRANSELRDLLWSLQRMLDRVALAGPLTPPPAALKSKVLQRIRTAEPGHPQRTPTPTPGAEAGLEFRMARDTAGWKQLPVPGAWIKLLSFEPRRGYAVLLGKLDPGTRYPAHANAGPEDFYILTGDLHVSGRRLGPGDFHHADAGSQHVENYSLEGCTLLAVLTVDDPLVSLAMS